MASGVVSPGPPVVVNAPAKHTATVIFLHGLGDSGHSWVDVAKMLGRQLPHVKWVLPHSPYRKITANLGMTMPGWFDLYSFSEMLDQKEDDKGLLASAAMIDGLIQNEIDTGVPSQRIVVSGFSQGGALSLLVGLADQRSGGPGGRTLGGVAAFSGWLPLHKEFPKMVSTPLTKMPVLMCHGEDDPLVFLSWGEKSSQILEGLGLPKAAVGEVGICYKSYPGVEHSVSQEELADFAQFLKRVLPSD